MTISHLLAMDLRRTLREEVAPVIAGIVAMLAGLLVLKGLGLREVLDGATLGGVGFGIFLGVAEFVRGHADATDAHGVARLVLVALLEGIGGGMLFRWLLAL